MPCYCPITVRHPRIRSEKWKRRIDWLWSHDRDQALYESSNTPTELTVPCGHCPGCRKARAHNWRVRLHHELMYGGHKNAVFVTLTFDKGHYFRLSIPDALRKFKDAYRYRFGGKRKTKFPPHWFITELGEGRGRLHIHGIIFSPRFYIENNNYDSFKRMNKVVRSLWPYGNTWVGYVDHATCSYITTYITKKNDYDPLFIGRVYVSPGLGKAYISDTVRSSARSQVYLYRHPTCVSGSATVGMPPYYVSKVTTQDERYRISLRRFEVYKNNPPPFSRYFGKVLCTSPEQYEAIRRSHYNDALRFGLIGKSTFGENSDILSFTSI